MGKYRKIIQKHKLPAVLGGVAYLVLLRILGLDIATITVITIGIVMFIMVCTAEEWFISNSRPAKTQAVGQKFRRKHPKITALLGSLICGALAADLIIEVLRFYNFSTIAVKSGIIVGVILSVLAPVLFASSVKAFQPKLSSRSGLAMAAVFLAYWGLGRFLFAAALPYETPKVAYEACIRSCIRSNGDAAWQASLAVMFFALALYALFVFVRVKKTQSGRR